MARLISSPPPSPCPSKSWLDAFYPGATRDYEILTIEYGVLITMIFLFGLFVLGCQRRYVHDTWQGDCILFLYTVTTIGIPYLTFLMRRYLHLKLFPIWAYFLIFVYGGFDTMTACNLSDNERSLSACFRFFPLIFGTANLIEAAVNESGQGDILSPFPLLYQLTVCNAIDTFGAFVAASKTIGLPEITSLTDRYMRNKFNSYDDAEDPVLGLRRRSYSFRMSNFTLMRVGFWVCRSLGRESLGNTKTFGSTLFLRVIQSMSEGWPKGISRCHALWASETSNGFIPRSLRLWLDIVSWKNLLSTKRVGLALRFI